MWKICLQIGGDTAVLCFLGHRSNQNLTIEFPTTSIFMISEFLGPLGTLIWGAAREQEPHSKEEALGCGGSPPPVQCHVGKDPWWLPSPNVPLEFGRPSDASKWGAGLLLASCICLSPLPRKGRLRTGQLVVLVVFYARHYRLLNGIERLINRTWQSNS